ncbi:MAG: hypothetical protein SGJ18_09125 [Pseudomonadota bacterium]|nr:hypothetical protein [Pseudomonadota bacterium]
MNITRVYLNKLSAFTALFLLLGACVVHKSEHRKFFEENGSRFLNSQSLTFKVLDLEWCEGVTPQVLGARLHVDPKNFSGYSSLELLETKEQFCMVYVGEPGISGTRSWICPTTRDLSCWEHIN